nr:unnamed protein product [Digitaria exilis]
MAPSPTIRRKNVPSGSAFITLPPRSQHVPPSGPRGRPATCAAAATHDRIHARHTRVAWLEDDSCSADAYPGRTWAVAARSFRSSFHLYVRRAGACVPPRARAAPPSGGSEGLPSALPCAALFSAPPAAHLRPATED